MSPGSRAWDESHSRSSPRASAELYTLRQRRKEKFRKRGDQPRNVAAENTQEDTEADEDAELTENCVFSCFDIWPTGGRPSGPLLRSGEASAAMECICIHTYAAIEPTPPRDTAAQGASSVADASRPGNRSRLTRRVTTVSYEAMYSTLYPLTLSSWLDCELPPVLLGRLTRTTDTAPGPARRKNVYVQRPRTLTYEIYVRL